jgi:outer membrane biosynthesis protein TonB
VRGPSSVGLIGAILLHVAIVAATLFSWSHRLDIADETPPVVPVDLVTIGQKTNIAPMVKQAPKAPPKEEIQPPAPVPTPAPQPPAQQQATEAPPPPEAEKSEPVLKKPPPPPVVQKPQPQPDAKKDKFDINNIMALLDKRAPSAQSAPNAKVGARTVRGIGQQNAMTMDLVDSLRNQIAQCWSPPVGAPHPEQLIVSFELFLNPDGSVAQPPQLLDSSSGDSFGRAAAEAARRAIYTCAPYKLPADRFAQWRDITLKFDPRLMVGQ